MKIHFIAIGGSAMHNLAIALHLKAYEISGSDDEIFNPSRRRLEKYHLLPEEFGWFPQKITKKLDAVILGMHAKADNPELLRAKEIGLKIYSYPEFLYEHAKAKKRIVIGGSHGKTTITSMILHVLQAQRKDCDYMVGAQLEGFEVMVRLTEEADCMVLEGDEYLTSPLDRRPKFHLYKPDIALISGIAWDHINVFPTFKDYVKQFEIFRDMITLNGSLIYCENDAEVKALSQNCRSDIKQLPYTIPPYYIDNGITNIRVEGKAIALQIFGEHNLLNLMGAKYVCNEMGVSDTDFFEAIKTFNGASKRLQLLEHNAKSAVYKDFAHSPSKLKATCQAVKMQFPERKLIGVMELHTFSSLNEDFLSLYKGTMDSVDMPMVYFSDHALKLKRLPSLSIENVKKAFANTNIEVFTDAALLFEKLSKINYENKNLLLMSSGNFDGFDLEHFASKILGT